MTERMHREDLRAIVASLLAPATNYAGVDWKAHGIKCADEMLAELERTAKPEAPAPIHTCHEPGCECPYSHTFTIPCNKCGHAPKAVPIAPTRTCSEVDETAPVPDAGIPPMPKYDPRPYAPVLDSYTRYIGDLQDWGRDLAHRLRAILNSHAIVSDALAQAVKPEAEPTDGPMTITVDPPLPKGARLTVEMPTPATTTTEHWRQECGKLHSQVARLKVELAQAEAKERERVISVAEGLYTEAASHPSYGRLFARKLRAALEPKPEVPRG